MLNCRLCACANSSQRDTYMIRITELKRMDISARESDDKALPARPLSQESYGDLFRSHEDADGEAFSGDSISPRQHSSGLEEPRALAPDQFPPMRQSSLSSALDDDVQYAFSSPEYKGQHGRSQSQSPWQKHLSEKSEAKGRNRLSPKLSDQREPPGTSSLEGSYSHSTHYSETSLPEMNVKDANGSTSWLDTIDESGASSPSSLHSKKSSAYLQHLNNHRFSRSTEAEFDAALDAAVEAAYDEGLEPALETSGNDDDIVSNARRNVELAKQKVREAEREAEVAMTRGQEMRRIQEQAVLDQSKGLDPEYLDEEAEEEERLLEEMTKGYVMDDFEFDVRSKSALPRQSDSSSFSGRTWESSAASNITTAGAALFTLAEDDPSPSAEGKTLSNAEPPLPPASTASPRTSSSPPRTGAASGLSVRERRLSGQNPKELKIQTNAHFRDGSDASASEVSTSRLPPLPKNEPQTSLPINAKRSLDPASALQPGVNFDRNASIGTLSEEIPTATGLSKALTQDDDDDPNSGLSVIPPPVQTIGKVPSAPDNLGKQNPNSKTFRARNVSVPAPDVSTDSPGTPSSSMFPTLDLQKGMASGAVPILPTPTGANFTPNGLPSDGLYIFDSHIHSPAQPGLPNIMAANHPAALEPCPESFLLRPFWLMRSIYQTIAHPSGGYLSTKLFIPRDVWRVKNAKIKAMEEKVSNCDFLTAALLKLSQVDTYDADAVLEEMQSFESVLDQVQASLSKKLGSDVGVHGAMPLFKTSPVSDDAPTAADALPPKASNAPSSKSYLTSWRKLRSKNSGFGSAAPSSNSRETSKDNLTINSLPMTPTPTSQTAKRDVTQLHSSGPNANYMGALARLCDAAQVIGECQFLDARCMQDHEWLI